MMILDFAVRLPNFVVFIPIHSPCIVVEVLVISVVVITIDVIVKVISRYGWGKWEAGGGVLSNPH